MSWQSLTDGPVIILARPASSWVCFWQLPCSSGRGVEELKRAALKRFVEYGILLPMALIYILIRQAIRGFMNWPAAAKGFFLGFTVAMISLLVFVDWVLV